MSDSLNRTAFWLSTANPMMVELARDNHFKILVLDLEHGAFDQSQLNIFIPFCKAMGFAVYAKVLGPEAIPIQQALDYGANGVIIPHIEDLEHARRVTAIAKYPPLGSRSFAGGRIVNYGAVPEGFFSNENKAVACLPMIESAAALQAVEEIIALPTVDGVFVGPTDLSLSRGRPDYRFNEQDQADIARIAQAAYHSGKPWIMPAWTAPERQFSLQHDVAWMVVMHEQGVAASGMKSAVAVLGE